MPYRKFVERIDVSGWEVETDKGYRPVRAVGKTVPYEVWEVETEGGRLLRCADTHILFDEGWNEVFAKDLRTGSPATRIWTSSGIEEVKSVRRTGMEEGMYDVEVDSPDHRYVANGLVSHNSIFLCNDAANFMKMGKNVAFITLEMSEKKVIKRIGANLLDIPTREYDAFANDQEKMARRISDFRKRQLTPLGRLFIKEYPTGCCTTIDVENYVRQLEETHGIKIHVVVLDYINIMRNYRNPNSENTYMSVKQLAEDLRGIAVKNNLLIITATQSTRTAFDSSDIVLSQVSESMGLVATSDTVYGIIQDNEMRINNEYLLKILKIRDGAGKNDKMKMIIDYAKMRMKEEGTVISETGTVSGGKPPKPTTVIKAPPKPDEGGETREEGFSRGGFTVTDLRKIRGESGEISQSDLDF